MEQIKNKQQNGIINPNNIESMLNLNKLNIKLK